MSTDQTIGCAARNRRNVFLATLFLFTFLTSAEAQVYSASLEELAQTSTSVVVGKTSNVRSFWNEDRSRIMTEVTIEVDETVAGDAAGQTVITIPGGRVGNSMYEVSDMPIFIEGEEVVVFLWQDSDGRNLVTGGAQGRIGISTDETLRQRVVMSASPALQKTPRGIDERSNQATDPSVSAPEEKLLLNTLIKRIKDARER